MSSATSAWIWVEERLDARAPCERIRQSVVRVKLRPGVTQEEVLAALSALRPAK